MTDSSSLIGLAQIGQFELLNQLFAEIYIPESVYNEVVAEGKGEPGAEETEKAVRNGLMIRKAAADQFAAQAFTSTLGEGESEVMIIYKELTLDYAIIADRTARN
jgi:predicted nucleic acid-binding protein